MKAVDNADDSVSAVARFECQRADDAVDARCGSAANQDTHMPILTVLEFPLGLSHDFFFVQSRFAIEIAMCSRWEIV
jgi:hypothetical protein